VVNIRLRLILPLVGVLVALAGCATVPKVTSPTGVDVSVSQMSPSTIRSYYGIGVSGDLNPFIPAGGMLHKQKQDFIVLRISVASLRDADVTLDRATARDAQGNDVADLYTWRQFEALLKHDYFQGRDYQQVYSRARNAYMNPFDVSVRPGRSTYVVVLVGKHPLPFPVSVKVDVTVGLNDLRTFTLAVTGVS